MRSHRLVFAAASLLLACSSSDGSDTTDYSGDPLAAIKSYCQSHLASSAICGGACPEADSASCFPQSSKTLFKDPGFGPYIDCRNACPGAKTCPASGAKAESTVADCDCETSCAAKQSKRFQGYLAETSDCDAKLAACVQ